MNSTYRTTNAALAILACLLWSTAFAAIKIGLRYSDPIGFAGARFMLAGLLLVPFWWCNNPDWLRAVKENLRLILVVSFFQTFLIIPVCGASLSWLLLPDESPSPSSLTGMACITLAIIIFNLAAPHRKRGVDTIP